MKHFRLAAALAFALVSTAASADEASPIHYNYLDLGYYNLDSDADGYMVRGGFKIADSGVFATASYARVNLDVLDVNVNLYSFGLGYAHSIAASTDLTGEVAYQKLAVLGESADAWRGTVGVAHAFSDKFQGSLKVNHYFGGDLDSSDTTGTAAAELAFTPNWSAIGEVEFGSGDSTYLVGGRYNF